MNFFSNMADTEKEICHSTHSYEWRLGQRKPKILTCNKAGTVEDSLRRSSQFKENEEKNKHKELVVVRYGKPIPSHFPCTLIQPGEKLVVHYVNSKPAGKAAVTKTITRSSEQMVVFNLQTKGGKNITKIIRNPAIRSYSEITVYGYKGEKVKHALKRDGRFLRSIFKKTCALSDFTADVEMSNLVDDLNGKTFQITMLNRNSPPKSQPSSLEDALDTFEHDDSNKYGDELHEIPDSRVMRARLSSLVRDFIEKRFTDQKSDKHQLLSVEYGRNQGSVTVETMKKLMILSDSVCQVRIRGSAVGSGFLLFGAFVLTNYHVIKPVLHCNRGQLSEPVTVHFSFQSLDRAAEGHQVKAVVASEYCSDVEGHKCDWVLLELNADQALPQSLLTHFGFIPDSGSICIIGHPHGDVKRVDQSWIITKNSHSQIIEKHYNENLKYSETGEVIQFVTTSFAEGVAKALDNSRYLTYETCFFFGSSGSPVFDNYCNIVAMHSGGFVYESSSGETQSVIEYGHLLSSILENLIIQLVFRGRLDVLKQFLVCCNKHYETIIHNVKKLATSRNYAIFHNTAKKDNISNDDTLKMFFEFICEPDTPVAMDIGWSP